MSEEKIEHWRFIFNMEVKNKDGTWEVIYNQIMKWKIAYLKFRRIAEKVKNK